MPKIAFIGAGSLGFTRTLVRDILTFPLLENSTLALIDIGAERLDFAKRNEEIVRNEMLLHLGYYVTESSGHNSEYNWWFRKRPDLIEKYCMHGTGWNPGKHAYILKEYLRIEKYWKKDVDKWFKDKKAIDLKRGHEYAAYIINAYMGGEPFEFNGNVPNKGLITNLPQEVCVEVPVFANKRGFNPIYVGPLPPQCAALNNINIAVEEMVVQAALTGDPKLVFYAI